MVKKLPLVLCSSESTEPDVELDDGTIIIVGSNSWFNWIKRVDSFRFESGFAGEDSFTARKQIKENNVFWYAFKKVDGTLRTLYLGKPDDLVPARLIAVAMTINDENFETKSRKKRTTGNLSVERLEEIIKAQNERNSQLEAILKQQNERIAFLEKHLEAVNQDNEEHKVVAIEYQQLKAALRDILIKHQSKEKGYLTNAFGQGLADLKELV